MPKETQCNAKKKDCDNCKKIYKMMMCKIFCVGTITNVMLRSSSGTLVSKLSQVEFEHIRQPTISIICLEDFE